MTDHEHAATGPGPGSGPRPGSGTGTTDMPGATGPAGTPGADGTPPAAPDSRPFRRDRRHKMIAGVCAGLGRQTDMDPVIYRITLAVLAATGGIGLIFYGFAWLLVPQDDEEENEVRKLLTGRVDGQALAAVLFALVGCGVVLTTLRNAGALTFAVVLSLLLAGAGYWSRHRGTPDPDPSPSSPSARPRSSPIAAQAAADAPPEAQAPPVSTYFPSWWRDPIVKDGTHVGGTGYLWGPGDARRQDVTSVLDLRLRLADPWPHDTATPPPSTGTAPRPPRPRGPRRIGGWVFLLALLAGGLVTGLTWHSHPPGTSLQLGLASALAVLGLGMALGSFLGRTGAGTTFLAILTAALLAGVTALPADVTTQWRQTTWQPTTATDVRPSYDLGTGAATLDLSRVHPAKGRTVTTHAAVGAGRLRLIIPADTTAKVRIDLGVGDVQLPGDNGKDIDVQPDRHKQVTFAPATNTKPTGTLTIALEVGVGQVVITHATP
ncbi:PspC domain-containing protein [Streptomyces sp. DSM 110735]|uniref:PspC domain-containing protein n=1 Tax=Streptomyces sp. DSM 110735 TaxID=2775031 RepID=UPI0018F40188|nr:PspC domain-containing protein [Streptomyces sp. DSM 110735]MBJ7905457.1 PspC domain-containing protein [Streptomyces sp. DSM 110735]